MSDPALLEVLRNDVGSMAWLRNSLKHEIAEARACERHCRAFAGSPTMVLANQRLEAAHKAAAEAYGAALAALDAKENG